jgi:hypothetical protein
LFLIPITTSAWGNNGHRIIARIASDRLSPNARQEVAKLLGNESLETASIWADAIKSQRPDTAEWHVINWALSRNSYSRTIDCRNNLCIIEQINAKLNELRDSKGAATERAEALKWVVHLVGDLHQPFHVTTNAKPPDKGANLVLVTLSNGRRTNLHAVWDDEIIAYALAQSKLQTAEYATQLSNKFVAGPFTQNQSTNISTQGSVADWGLEAHWLSWEAYKLSNGWFMVEQDSDPTDQRKFRIDDLYLQKNRPIVEKQLVRAGARLAKLLNEVFARSSAF